MERLQDIILFKIFDIPAYDDSAIMALWETGLSKPCPTDAAANSQRAWDWPRVLAGIATLQSSASDARDKARLLAVTAPHSGDWLHALTIYCCGLKLDDEVITVARGLRHKPLRAPSLSMRRER